ncbi:hypothetical protein [Nonomuraea sp. NPDC049784]|uniref:hypothetical protein n=1 Tax=Nonomuraea sp. NPDC049784 TaxID=3154361 RepID=UPI0033E85248
MQDLRPGADGRGEEGIDELAVGCRESDVRLAETVAGRLLADPERGAVNAVSDDWTEFHDPSAAERRQSSVVEGHALDEISALNPQVIKHGGRLAVGGVAPEVEARWLHGLALLGIRRPPSGTSTRPISRRGSRG